MDRGTPQSLLQTLGAASRRPLVVLRPPEHEGVCAALKGSFGAIPAMPEEFVRLLDRLG